LQRALEAIASDTRPQAGARATVSPDVPVTLSSYGLGAWRWIGLGIYWRPVEIPREQDTRVFMLKAAPGTVLPHHKHTGAEWTCVLQGAFRHQQGRYGAGDFDEAGQQIEHHPVVEDGADCICLVALQGQLQLQGWFGRLLQPFVRF
jgi:putative transcriptional regulator